MYDSVTITATEQQRVDRVTRDDGRVIEVSTARYPNGCFETLIIEIDPITKRDIAYGVVTERTFNGRDYRHNDVLLDVRGGHLPGMSRNDPE